MNLSQINKRDIKIFLLGMLAMFAIITAYDWENNLEAFKNGFESGYSNSRTK